MRSPRDKAPAPAVEGVGELQGLARSGFLKAVDEGPGLLEPSLVEEVHDVVGRLRHGLSVRDALLLEPTDISFVKEITHRHFLRHFSEVVK